jgi:hypothetical protein
MTTPTRLRPPHIVLAGLVCLMAALAVGPLAAWGGPVSGPADPAPDRDGDGGIRVELSAAGVVAGGHGAAALLALPAPAASVAGGPWHPQLEPAVAPRALTRPFDRVSYRTTGPPHRVS